MVCKRLSLILMLLLSSAASATPVIQESETTYNIYGTDERQLRNEMNNLGPEDNGQRYDAYTSWYVEWHFNYETDSGLCKMTRVNVSVKITYTFPNWADYNKGDTALQNKWNNYITNLRSHEHNHANHGKEAATDIENMLLNLPPEQDCNTLSATANSSAQQIISDYNVKDKTYDNETRHGATEGVTFP